MRVGRSKKAIRVCVCVCACGGDALKGQMAALWKYHEITNGVTVDGKGFAGCAIASKSTAALARVEL